MNSTLKPFRLTFEAGGESGLLADALTVQGMVWARLGGFDASIKILRQAIRVAQDSGSAVSVGQAALTLIEEHGLAGRLSESELAKTYRRANDFLKGSQDAGDTGVRADNGKEVGGDAAT